MRVIICGGRDFTDEAWAFARLDRIHALRPITGVIEGGAKGLDAIGRDWARARGICVVTEKANWDLYGRRAGYLRNLVMAEDYAPDMVIAGPGGRGTEMMRGIARRKTIPVILLEKVTLDDR